MKTLIRIAFVFVVLELMNCNEFGFGFPFRFPFFDFDREGRPHRYHEDNSPAGIVRDFDKSGNRTLKVIDSAINQNISTSITQQLQQIRDTFAQCLQTAEQNLASVLNVTTT